MKNTKYLSLDFGRKKFEVIEQVNSEFSRVKIYVCAYGKNRNKTYISKKTLDSALPTLAYCPIVAHLYEEEDENGKKRYVIGGHDVQLTVDEDGCKLKDLTIPFGVVIADTYAYETVTEYGESVPYLTAEGFIWSGRYPDLMKAIYSDDIWFSQSMEAQFESWRDYKEDSNYTELLDLSFSALCLLNKSDNKEDNVEPCFISSRVEPVKFTFNNDFFLRFNEMKEKLAFCLKESNLQEGDNTLLNKETINTILSEHGMAAEDIDFEIAVDMSAEDFRARLEKFKKEHKKCSSVEKFAATYEQKRQALAKACDPIVKRDDKNNVVSRTSYWIQDFNDEYVFVERSFWSDNNEEYTFGRFSYFYDEAKKTATLTSDFEEMVVTWLTLEENAKLEASRNELETMKADFEAYKAAYSFPNTEVEDLKVFKAKQLKEQRIAEESAIFEKFDKKLNNDPDYEALKSNCKKLSLEQIGEKCFSILGRKLSQFSLNTQKSKTVKIPVANHDDDSDVDKDKKPYGDVYDKYLK